MLLLFVLVSHVVFVVSVFLFGAVCSEEGYEIGVRMKKKTHRMVICGKKSSRDGQKKNSLFLGKKGEPPKPRKGTAIFSGRTAKIQHIGFCGGLATAKIHTSTAKTQPLNRQNSDLGPPKLKWLRRQPPNLLCSIVRNFFDKFNSGFENLWCVIKRSTEHTRKFTYAKYYSYVVGLM